ncbi:acyl-CoA dehydrogenase family protein [Noviherbaspirillum soli]|uniref:acyl-CoA dehydrogenase family protein n=1 Tax=Noviherbaspirillum soli TaxID=1064518 RepID=UPI00188BF0E4|nr:acyl-CoA dehydrogenase [Noviherbaspirillum soli]
MTWELTPEQSMLRDSAERYFREHYPFEKRRAAPGSQAGADSASWGRFAEFGWLAAPFPESDGGMGGGPVEAAIIMEGIGASLAPEPYLPAVVLCGGLLAALGDDTQKQSWLQPLLEGASLPALAFAEPQSRYDLHDCLASARERDGRYSLNGHKAVVLGGAGATAYIVVARTRGAQRASDGLSLFVVPRAADGLAVIPYPTIDGLNACELRLQDVLVEHAALLGPVHRGAAALNKIIDAGAVAVAAEALGAMTSLFKLTLDYVKTRQQFGRPLSSNQALQHRLVDMHIALEETRAVVAHAVRCADSDDAVTRGKAVSAAKIQAGKTGRLIGQEAVQMHGAMGVTDESPVSHYFKRLTMIDVCFGNVSWHEQRYAQLTLDAGAANDRPA